MLFRSFQPRYFEQFNVEVCQSRIIKFVVYYKTLYISNIIILVDFGRCNSLEGRTNLLVQARTLAVFKIDFTMHGNRAWKSLASFVFPLLVLLRVNCCGTPEYGPTLRSWSFSSSEQWAASVHGTVSKCPFIGPYFTSSYSRTHA